MSARRQLPRRAALLLDALAVGARPARGLDPAVIACLESRDLAVRHGEDLRITQPGRAYLCRTQAAQDGVAVDPFRRQHLELEARTGDMDAPVLVNVGESPLVWLARRKGRDGRPLVDPIQLQAGERLRADFTRAQMGPQITSKWDATAGSGRRGHMGVGMDFSESAVAARQRVARALDRVGPEFAGLLLDVCCFLKRLEDVEGERGWPMRSGKVVLQLGLDRLARHYGYATHARGPKHQAITRWLASPPQAASNGD